MAGKWSMCFSAGWETWAKEEEEASISGPGEACRPFVLELFTSGRASVKGRWRESSVLSRFVQVERPRSSEEMASKDWVGRGVRARGARVLGAEEGSVLAARWDSTVTPCLLSAPDRTPPSALVKRHVQYEQANTHVEGPRALGRSRIGRGSPRNE